MPRQMANQKFRQDQWDRRYDAHIIEINQFVDEMRENGNWAPYVAPMYGGKKARLLSVLRDPGPKTQDNVGSGFICMENDDPTAERMCNLFASVGISANDVMPWNAYPWYINRHPKAAELETGVGPLKRMIDFLPDLRVVLLHGGAAHDGWKRFTNRYSEIVSERGLLVIPTYHTANRVFAVREDIREFRKQHLQTSFQECCPLFGNLKCDIEIQHRKLAIFASFSLLKRAVSGKN